MTYPELRDAAMRRLEQLGHGRHVRLLRHAVDRPELHSCLREYIFRTDAKTDAFLNEVVAANVSSLK
jgi:hypothetical protein